MVAVRALQRRVFKLEKISQPRSSPFAIFFGSIDKFVDEFIIPEIQANNLDPVDMVDLIGAIRIWEKGGIF